MNFLYDLGKSPASWDFLQFLINAEIKRRLSAPSSPLRVKFVDGPKDGFRDDNLPRPLEQRKAILDNVMRPALQLLGAEEGGDGQDGEVSYLLNVAVDCGKQGVEIPKWEVPESYLEEARAYLNGRQPVVVTLREASYFEARNSNLPAWLEFAKTCDVIFVRDTARADEPLEGFETCPRASKDFLFRAALMSLAKVNFLTAGGAALLCYFSDTPYFMFGGLTTQIPNYFPGSQEGWKALAGLDVGEQLPWAGQNQYMTWSPETLEEIQRAWDAFNNRPHKLGKIHTRAAVSEEGRLENCWANMERVKSRLQPADAHQRVAQLICYGPSLKQTFPAIVENPNSDIITVSGAYDYLIERNVVPAFHIECDPREHKVKMLNKPDPRTKFLLASCVHPSMLDKVENVDLWHLHNGKDSEVILAKEPDGFLVTGGGSVGLRAIPLLYILGYRLFFIHGMDCSFTEEQHAGSHTGKIVDVIEVTCGDRTFKSSTAFISYARDFMKSALALPGAHFQLFGDGLLQHMCRQQKLAA